MVVGVTAGRSEAEEALLTSLGAAPLFRRDHPNGELQTEVSS